MILSQISQTRLNGGRMFLDTANTKVILDYMDLKSFRGVTTNPKILEENTMSIEKMITHSKLDKSYFLYVQINGETFNDMKKYYESIESLLTENIGLKIPVTKDGILFYHYIKEIKPDILTLGTVVYTPSQAIIGVQSGFDYIALYYNRIEVNGIDAKQMIHDLKEFIDRNGYKTQIMGAGFKTPSQVTDAYIAGVDNCTVTPEIFEALIHSDLVNLHVKTFSECERL